MGDVPRRSTGSVGSRATSRNGYGGVPLGEHRRSSRTKRSALRRPSCSPTHHQDCGAHLAGDWGAQWIGAHLLGAWQAGKHLLGPWGHACGHAFEGTGGHFEGAWAQGRPLVGHWPDGMQEEPWPRPAAVRAKAAMRLVIALSSMVDEVVSRRLDRVDAQTNP
jgi:hypothetical protein